IVDRQEERVSVVVVRVDRAGAQAVGAAVRGHAGLDRRSDGEAGVDVRVEGRWIALAGRSSFLAGIELPCVAAPATLPLGVAGELFAVWSPAVHEAALAVVVELDGADDLGVVVALGEPLKIGR